MEGSCPICDGSHAVLACPEVVEVEYRSDGSIKRIVKRQPSNGTNDWWLDNYGTKVTYSGTTINGTTWTGNKNLNT